MDGEKDDETKAKWGPGQMDDGTIDIMTVEQAREAAVQRDADERAFDQMMTPDGEVLPLDLDDLSVEELDEIIDGLDDEDDDQ